MSSCAHGESVLRLWHRSWPSRQTHRTARDALSQEVSAAVEEQLAHDRMAELDGISVSVDEGHVTLHGTVPSLMAKERAARLARSVKGVRDVANEIALQPRETLAAAELRAVVRTALLWTCRMISDRRAGCSTALG